MDVFDLDRSLIGDYESFARSFTRIRAPDIRQKIDDLYATGRFWPEPLITVNPRFESGASIDALVADGTLRPQTASVFRIDGKPINLYRHQAQAIAKAAAGKSFVVTTGTGVALHLNVRLRGFGLSTASEIENRGRRSLKLAA